MLIVILAGIVGFEREAWKKPAGFRTYVLVGISSVLVISCGEYLNEVYGADPSRIPAQLLSGIGFIGAGTILRDGFTVKGLTTAAALLAVTCVGLVVGSGYYLSAIIATFVIYIILSYSHKLSGKLEHIGNWNLKISSKNPKVAIAELEETFKVYGLEIIKIENKNEYINLSVQHSNAVDKNQIICKMMTLNNIDSVVEMNNED